jgi:nitrite reductase/ring-hydroxylating ferredoxin subunit
VTRILEAAAHKGAAGKPQPAQDSQLTLPPTVNWFDEDRFSTSKWQLMPPIITGHLAAVTPASSQRATDDAATGTPPATGALPDQPTTTTSAKLPAMTQINRPGDSLAGIDPFAWWTGHAASNSSPTPGTFAQRSPVRLAKKGARYQPGLQERRRVVKLIATGGAVAGVLAVGGTSFAHFAQSLKNSQLLTTSAPTTHGTTATTPGNTPTAAPTHGTGPQKTATPTNSPTAHPSPTAQPTKQPTQQPTPHPTQPPPTPTPTPPSHTGTVIGHTNMPSNSSVTFTNPADGQSSLLIRLANGNFVACERACTHQGVPVDFNNGQLVCPAHNAIFDPANGFNQLPGSGPSGLNPLPGIKISVNADGTITTE